ncbi:hypothetical protein [Burkholderia vietnamiensis]|uniref:hypothetical protein n=1 Tax=Burkholderia vietnamiensis TaxID=60552 RepID=UPI00264EE9B2|nr:hypothetical protein [Burkholderia vietnamiensis]MDN8037439.1 hypothetical protein [Burkholderia vietnamiensis]
MYVIRRTNKADPTDTSLIFGHPGKIDQGYPQNSTFVTNDRRIAVSYCSEMNDQWGHKTRYEVEPREVRV